MTKRRRWLLAIAVILLAGGVAGWLNREWLLAKVNLLVLESPDRVQGLQIDRVIEILAVEPGQRVADIGAGTGLFARPLARAVDESGIVYAVDVNEPLLTHIDRTAAEQGIDNIRTVLAEEDDPLLPEPVELIFICDTLHHIEERAAYLETLRRYLLPAGRVAVIDFQGTSPHFDPSMKYEREELETWMEAAGYVLAESHDFVEDNFFVIYTCPTCPEAF